MYAPPTLRQLLAFPLYRAYLKKVPPMPDAVALRNPWQVWAYNETTERWGSAVCETYRDAYLKTATLNRSPQYTDIAIVSRTILHPMPRVLRLNAEWHTLYDARYDWCQRCRRPTVFRYVQNHRALRDAPALTTEDPLRCYYCGARKCFAGEEMLIGQRT